MALPLAAGRAAWRRLLLLAAVVAAAPVVLLATTASPAGAHPLGNYTINHYNGLVVSPSVVRIDHVIDLAEIPTVQERQVVDTDGNGEVSEAEATSYAPAACAREAGGLDLRVDGRQLDVAVAGAAVTFPAGQAGLDTLRLECALDATPRNTLAMGRHRVAFEDHGQAQRIGWREVTLSGVGVDIDAPTRIPVSSVSDRLRSYPSNSVTDPQRVTSIDAGISVVDRAAVAPALAQTGVDAPAHRPAKSDPFTDLIGRADAGIGAALAALAFAAALGALHGLAPGHGKTVVAAYLVGTRGNRRQAFGLALAVALSHTLGVFVLGAVTLAASAAFPLERVYGWLQLGSATLIIGFGTWLTVRLVQAWRSTGRASVTHRPPVRAMASVGAAVRGDLAELDDHELDDFELDDHAPHHGHHHPGEAPGVQDHGHADSADGHQHLHHDHHPHDHHPHDHPHHDHHPHDDHGNDHEHHDDRGDRGDRGDGHRHGLFGHRHRTDWEHVDVAGVLGWRALATLGLSGGMVPSASAVIVLLGAVQVGRIPFGAALIIAFGVGLSAALVGVGLGAVAVTRHTSHYLDTHALAERFSRLITPLAAAALLLVGAWLAYRALGRI